MKRRTSGVRARGEERGDSGGGGGGCGEPFPGSRISLGLAPLSPSLHAFSLSPLGICRGGPPVAPSGGSESAGARRRHPEVDLARDVEAAAWVLVCIWGI
jgi:hypothetical protein